MEFSENVGNAHLEKSQTRVVISKSYKRFVINENQETPLRNKKPICNSSKLKQTKSSRQHKIRGNNRRSKITKQKSGNNIISSSTSNIGRYYKIYQNFTYLEEFYQYKIVKEIGRGGYGIVYKAYNNLSADRFASSGTSEPSTLSLEETPHHEEYHEYKNQSEMPYPCVIKINFNTISRELVFSEIALLQLVRLDGCRRAPWILDAFVHEQTTHVVFKHYKFTPYMVFFNRFQMLDIKHYLFELLLALQELKHLGICHRDVKPSNFLYNLERKRGILIDYGIAEVSNSFLNRLKTKVKLMNKQKTEIQKQLKKWRQNSQISHEHHGENFQEQYWQISSKLKKAQLYVQIYQKIKLCQQVICRNKIGTEVYMPLQTLLKDPNQSFQTDMWAVGVIFLQFVTRKYSIFNSILNPEDLVFIKQGCLKTGFVVDFTLKLETLYGAEKVKDLCSKLGYQLTLPYSARPTGTPMRFRDMAIVEGFDAQAEDLLARMLELFRQQRISVQEAIQHPFFDEVRSEHGPKPSPHWLFGEKEQWP